MAKQKSHIEIRTGMLKLGITQEEMSKRLGLSLCTFNRKLNGLAPWYMDEGKRVASILGSTLDALFLAQDVTNLKQQKSGNG